MNKRLEDALFDALELVRKEGMSPDEYENISNSLINNYHSDYPDYINNDITDSINYLRDAISKDYKPEGLTSGAALTELQNIVFPNVVTIDKRTGYIPNGPYGMFPEMQLDNTSNNLCLHEYKQYIGLVEIFEYCTKCDIKK